MAPLLSCGHRKESDMVREEAETEAAGREEWNEGRRRRTGIVLICWFGSAGV